MTADQINAESTVIGSILIDPRCLGAAAALLQPQDFALEINRTLYRAALKLDREGKPADLMLLLEECRRMGAEVSREYIVELMDLTPTAANVEEYARLTREASLNRGGRAVYEAGLSALESHVPVQEVLLETQRKIDALLQEGPAQDLVAPDEAMLAFYSHRERVDGGKGSGFLRTGYQDLDENLGGGLLASGMYVLAARPGMGKTTLAVNIADRLARDGTGVLFVSLEMDPEQLEAKRLSRETGIPASQLLMGVLNEEQQAKVAEAADVIRSLPVHLNRRDAVTVAQIEAMARKVRGLGLIVIDYLGKVAPEDRRRSRYEYTTEISGDIKTLARRFRIPVLALCQLNRETAGRKDPTPVLSDLRDTGAIEQDADGVIFLHREDYYRSGSGEAADLQVIVAKNRHGPVGECRLAFDMAASKMTTSRRWSPSRSRHREPEYKQAALYSIPSGEPIPWPESAQPKEKETEGYKVPF